MYGSFRRESRNPRAARVTVARWRRRVGVVPRLRSSYQRRVATPAISAKYGETVCVAGIRTDLPEPRWLR